MKQKKKFPKRKSPFPLLFSPSSRSTFFLKNVIFNKKKKSMKKLDGPSFHSSGQSKTVTKQTKIK